MKLTPEEKEIIKQINHPIYTPEYCEGYTEMEVANVFTNAPLALIQMGVKGFVACVRAIRNSKIINNLPTADGFGGESE